MPRPTMAEYKKYLMNSPRTFGWGVLLIYDRFKTNMLLAQEHIDNLDLGKWIPLVNFENDVDGLVTNVTNLQLDRPRLSFVNSNLGASRARLSMNVISGQITQLRRQPGSDQYELVSYSQLDLLTAPSVHMDIFLNESNEGNVNEEGRVTFDLSKGASYTFEVSTWKELNEKLGLALAKEFESWDIKDRVWELNVLKPVQGEFNPVAFQVRTHSLARAQQIPQATEEEMEEGAVIVGVSFVKGSSGSFPGQDSHMPYLLPSPDDESEPMYTMNLLYNNEAWLKDVLFELVGKIPALKNAQINRDNDGFYGDVTAAVQFSVSGKDDTTRRDYEGFSINRYKWPDLDFRGSLIITRTEDVLNIDWSAKSESDDYVVELIAWDGVRVVRPDGGIEVKMKGGLKIKLAPEASRLGELDIVGLPTELEYISKFWGTSSPIYDGRARTGADDYVLPSVKNVVDEFLRQIDSLADTKIPFNLLRLNGLLFRGANVATPRTLLLPGDLSLLGDLAPKLTTFAVEPLESVISAAKDQTLELKLAPVPVGDADWSVKPVDGASGDVGTISKGIYTPPAIESISGTYKQVIATATHSGHTSSALITVVLNSVSVYPYFFIAQFNPVLSDKGVPRYVLVGGDITSELTWAMVDGSKGSIRLPEDSDSDLDIPKGKNVRVYVSPERSAGQAGEVEALIHLDRVKVSAGGLTQWIDVIIPWTTVSAKIVTTKVAEGGLRLVIKYYDTGTGEEVELTPHESKWAVLLGTGKIDPATGIYTPGPFEGPYIIVAGRETPPERTPIWGYSVVVLSPAAKRAVVSDLENKKEIQS